MELDEYKLKAYQRFGGSFTEKSVSGLEAMVRNQANSVVQKIEQSIKLEIIFALIFVIFITYVLLRYPGNHIKILALATLGFCIAFIGYLALLYRKISAYHAASLSVKENIERLISIIKTFIRLYFQTAMIFLPAAFFLVFITVTADNNYPLNWIPAQKIFTYISVASGWCITMYYFTKWYVRMLYGKHLQHLNDHLDELQDVSQG